jgi:hypothetical protein
MTKRLIVVSILLLCYSVVLASQGVYTVPKPQLVEYNDRSFDPYIDDVSVKILATDTLHLNIPIGELRELWLERFKCDLSLNTDLDMKIIAGIPPESETFKKLCQERKIWPEDQIGEEGYILEISENGIIIAANTCSGVFYGFQSLKQIIRGLGEKEKLPGLKIIDWPDLKFRGVQDDISRGPVPTLEFMKSQVRRLAELKINNLSYYIEHIVQTKRHADFAPAHGAVPINEWKDLCDYAAKYHIKVVGNFQSLGHFEEILAYPQYAPLGETERMLSPIREESFKFLQDIYEEMVPVFSSPYFNANCDETWDLGRRESKNYTDSLGIGTIYSNFINRINKEIKKYDKRLMIWGDIVFDHPKIFDLLDKDIVLGTWTYGALESFESYLIPFKKSGFDFMFSCGVLNSERILPDYNMTMTNIKNFVRDGAKYGAIGMLNTVWDDGGTALFSLDWYGVAYGADQSWHINDDSIDQYNLRFDRGIYGNLTGSIGNSFTSLNKLADLSPTQEMNDKIFWKQIIPSRRHNIQIDLNIWDAVEDNVLETEKTQEQIKAKYFKADIDYLKFVIQKYKYLYESRQQVAQAAENYRTACIVQKESGEEVQTNLISSLKLLKLLRNELIDLKELNVKLWRMENREYWLDHIEEMYDGKISEYSHAINLLEKAVLDFENGYFLPPPNEVRLDVRVKSGNYFQYWLLCGPFPNIKWQGRETDYLKPIGGELIASPIPGDNFTTGDGRKMRWVKYASPLFSKINLADVYEENTEVLVYAFCRIESPEDKKVRATFGSNDGIQLFLNGQRVYKKYSKRSLILDEDETYLSLKKGKNILLLKIDQNKGDWGFSFRLPDEKIRNHKYKYRLLND